ncbi:MAG: hypothetical protein JO113_09700, partial [Candidatus Eremiobacteraeota bacterium]|nr:hypothetical protein [Candidatus Eremiobacteraeota bacterium]
MFGLSINRVVSAGALFACLAPVTARAQQASPAPQPSLPVQNAPMTISSPLPTSTPENRRALPAPLDPVFPSTDFPGPAYLIGVPSDPGIRSYGWLDPGFELSTSKNSNYPLSYNDVPASPQIDQF